MLSSFLLILQALDEASCSKPGTRDSGFGETWYPDREVPSYRREDSVESLDSVESRTLSVASDCTLIAGSEGRSTEEEFALCTVDDMRVPRCLTRLRCLRNETVAAVKIAKGYKWIQRLHQEHFGRVFGVYMKTNQ